MKRSKHQLHCMDHSALDGAAPAPQRRLPAEAGARRVRRRCALPDLGGVPRAGAAGRGDPRLRAESGGVLADGADDGARSVRAVGEREERQEHVRGGAARGLGGLRPDGGLRDLPDAEGPRKAAQRPCGPRRRAVGLGRGVGGGGTAGGVVREADHGRGLVRTSSRRAYFRPTRWPRAKGPSSPRGERKAARGDPTKARSRAAGSPMAQSTKFCSDGLDMDPSVHLCSVADGVRAAFGAGGGARGSDGTGARPHTCASASATEEVDRSAFAYCRSMGRRDVWRMRTTKRGLDVRR